MEKIKIEKKLLLTPEDIKPSFPDWKVIGAFNPGATRLPDKRIVLFARVAEKVVHKKGEGQSYPVIISEKDYNVHYGKISKRKVLDRGRNVIYLKGGICRLTTISHLRKIVLSEDGFFIEKIEEIPAFVGAPGDGDLGVEDPRIIKIGGHYLMTYVSVCQYEGVCTSLAISDDLKNWSRKGIIFRQQNKDVVIFPEKINGDYVAFHRPEGTISFSRKSIWISHSPDLIHWGREKSVMFARPGSWGDGWIGSGPPPIKTKRGWLLFYHGAKEMKDRKKYYAIGAALFDLKNPEKLIARSSQWEPLIKPSAPYEKKGFIDGVIFPTGAVVSLDGKSVLLYAGGADRVVSVTKLNLNDVIKSLENSK